MPSLSLFHFDIPTWGNYGDKALFPVVRDAYRVLGNITGDDTGFDFTSAAALRREVDSALVARINDRCDAVVIGGGGLFLQDTNPNRLSGWQWKISAEVLAEIKVPLIVYALGDNRFPGQPEFDDLMKSHVSQVLDQSVFFGLRNTGSIETMSAFLGLDSGSSEAARAAENPGKAGGTSGRQLNYQPCPTTIAGLLYEPLIGRRPDPREKILAIQMLVHARQIAAGFDAEVIHHATVEAARRLVDTGWQILSVPFHPDDAEVSRMLVDTVPQVKEIRLFGPDIGFFDGFDFFSSVPYVLGGRGHAQMIPFGVGAIPLSLDLHAKLGYFASDIDHPELVIPVGPEGRASQDTVTEGVAANDLSESEKRERITSLAERMVAAVEAAYDRGPELQPELAGHRQRFFDLSADNLSAIRTSLGASSTQSGNGSPSRSAKPRLRSGADIAAEEFHVAAVSESEEFSGSQTRDLNRTARELQSLRQKSSEALKRAEAERDSLRAQTENLQSEKKELAAGLATATALAAAKASRVDEIENRTAKDEARVLAAKTAHAVTWRAKRIVRKFQR